MPLGPAFKVFESIDFLVYEDGTVCVSNNDTLEEDQAEERDAGGDGVIVAHITYSICDGDREAAIDIILGAHSLEVPGKHPTTLEELARAIWAAGVAYGRKLAGNGLKASDF